MAENITFENSAPQVLFFSLLKQMIMSELWVGKLMCATRDTGIRTGSCGAGDCGQVCFLQLSVPWLAGVSISSPLHPHFSLYIYKL
jgi:hypothetical protein